MTTSAGRRRRAGAVDELGVTQHQPGIAHESPPSGREHRTLLSEVDDITTSSSRLGWSADEEESVAEGTENPVDWAFFSVLDYVNRADEAQRATGRRRLGPLPGPAAGSRHPRRRVPDDVRGLPTGPAPFGDCCRTSTSSSSGCSGRRIRTGPCCHGHGGCMLSTGVPATPMRSTTPPRLARRRHLSDQRQRRKRRLSEFRIVRRARSRRDPSRRWTWKPTPNGNFEILFGPEKRERNWLEVVPGTSSLLSPGVLPRLGDRPAGSIPRSNALIRLPAGGRPSPAIASNGRSGPSAIGSLLPSKSSSVRMSEGWPNTGTLSIPGAAGREVACPRSTTDSGISRRTSA